MASEQPSPLPTEGTMREKLAAYFLSMPPFTEQTSMQKKEYLRRLAQLGRIEKQEILQGAGAARPLVWGNPVELLQALLTAAQRLAAGLGQPLLLFPAKEADIRFDTLLHPRLLSLALTALLYDGVVAAPRQPLWVRLSEQSRCLAIAVTAAEPFGNTETLKVVKECTRLHGGSLVHSENTILFSCGQADEPPPGVRLYSAPTAHDLLQDSLSPVWTGFYAGVYASLSSSKEASSGMAGSSSSEESTSPSEGDSSSASD